MAYSNIRENISYKIYLQKETGLNVGEYYPMVIVNETITGETDKSDFARIKQSSDSRKICGFYKYGSSKNEEVGTLSTRGVVICKALEEITAGECCTYAHTNSDDTYGVKKETAATQDHDVIGLCLETVKTGEYTSILLQL